MIAPTYFRLDSRLIDALPTLGQLERVVPGLLAAVRTRLGGLSRLFDDDTVSAVARACSMSAMMRG